ncbi:MAG: co-chaperone GroES [Candidatus Tectimicrobiota bacterium]
MALRPLHDRLLVQRLEEKEQVQGGIIIPDTAKEKPQQAKVLAVGPGKVTDDGKLQPIDVKVGDTVVFGKYAGTEVKVDGDELLIIREDDVLGVLES